MNTTLLCRRITSCDDTLFASLVDVFVESFPENERRPLSWFKELVETEPRFHCVVYPEELRCAALLCYWHFDRFVYVEYLAVNPAIRSSGLGSRLMQEFLDNIALPVVLEVEPPVSPLTERRIGFYQRLGFRLLPDNYIQPSYGVVPGLPLRLMLCGEISVTTTEMIRTIHREVYSSFEDFA